MQTITEKAAADYRRELGNGLVLRWSTIEDTEKIARMVGHVFRDKKDEPENEFLADVVRNLMSGRMVVMGENDYGIIEDTSREGNPIVAGVCLQRLTWSYEGVTFTVGRPEIVASDPGYRRQGFIRELFDLVHARSEAEGHMVQAITGIPNFYRQFGYEYALDLDGWHQVLLENIPQLKEGEQEAYTMREATIEHLPIIKELYQRHCERYMVATQVTDAYWHYMLEGWQDDPRQLRILKLQLILDSKQTIVGVLAVSAKRWRKGITVSVLSTAPGVNLQAMTPAILRALKHYGQEAATTPGNTHAFSKIAFALAESHPLFEVVNSEIMQEGAAPYAWYIRVPELPRFVMHLAPALERRLAASALAGYSGDFKLNFYRSGLRLVFEQGRLTAAEPWRAPMYSDNSDANFPPGIFLKALFGYRSLDELRQSYPDAWSLNEALFNVLFPRKSSWGIAWP